MSVYRIVITPEREGADASRPDLEATIKVETGAPDPRIIEMTVRSTAPSGLFATDLPGIDLEAIVRVLSAGVRAAVPGPAAPDGERLHSGAQVSDSSPSRFAGQPVDRPGATPDDHSEDEPAATQAALPIARPRKPVAAPASASPVEHTAGNGSGRAYRRMPAVDEVRAAYERIGSVTGLAQHFNVPRHTAQGWMTRVRKLTDSTS